MPTKGWRSFEKNTDLAEIKKQLANVDSKAKGEIAESYVCARLTELGFDVWQPYMKNHTTDVAIYHKGKFARIQVKSAGFDLQSDRFRAMLTTRDKTGKHIGYSIDDVDFFIVKCEGVWAFYVVPAEIGVIHTSLNFYPHRERTWGVSFDAEEYQNAFHLIKTFLGMDGIQGVTE